MNRKLLLLVIFFSFCTTLKAQMIYLPDTAWKNFLMTQGLSSCITGDSLDASCPAILGITSLDCNHKNIYDISGIRYFSNLIDFTCTSNNITDIPILPNGLINFTCAANQLQTLDSLPVSLQSLNCTNNSIQFMNQLPSTLKYLYCAFNDLLYIDTLLDSLEILVCNYNQFTSLNYFPKPATLFELNFSGNNISGSYFPDSNLRILKCSQNQINYLGPLPPNLDILECDYNQLNNLPNLPTSLSYLSCDQNNLSTLPNLPISLNHLSCRKNNLSSLPTLPPNLWHLNISNNYFSSLPLIPSTLVDLFADYNQLDSIPYMPNLIQLLIDHNLFSSFPLIPNSVSKLDISNNNISTIDSLPDNLYNFTADSCQLISIPDCPTSLSTLNVSYNNIQSFGTLPDSLYELSIDNNPISCISVFHFANFFKLRNTNISCLPNRIQFQISDLDPDTIPLCDITSGCPVNWNIRGHVNHDLNLDCNHDSSENFLHNIPVILKSGGVVRQVSYSTRYGEYSFKAPFGSYFVMVDTASEPFKYNCPIGGYTYITLNTTDSISDSLNFHLKCRITNDKLVKSVTPNQVFRPGRPTRVDINAGDASTYHGTTCFNDTGIVYVVLSSNVSYVGQAAGALTPTQVNGDTIIWNIPDFSTVVPSRDFNILLTTNTSATIGDTVCIQVIIQPINDFDSTNNIIQECFPVRASFDPNEKWISPEVADTSDHEFTFTILFQNTGTAPAYDIYLIDTLDNDLNASTFELLGSSHEVMTSIFPGNILRFNFNAIELPDSNSNEAASHGFVKYRIKRKSNTGAGTEITNTAYIYFDNNAPIVTNTVRVEIATPVGTSEFDNNEITIYPNPANQFLTVSSKNKIEQIQLFDIFGKPVLSKSDLNSNSIILNVANLSKGIYFVNVKENKGETIWNKKVVIY